MSVRDALFSERKRNFVEGTRLGGIIIPIIKIKGFNVYLYGGGRDIFQYITYFYRNGVHIKGIIDSDLYKRGKKVLGVPYIIVDEIDSIDIDPSKDFLIVTTRYFADNDSVNSAFNKITISNCIYRAGFDASMTYEVNGYEKNEMTGGLYGWVNYFQENVNLLEETENLLFDEMSKRIMEEYIRAIVECEEFKLQNIDGRNKYFVGMTFNGEEEIIYKHLDDEVWINVGACLGDNIFLYFEHGYNAKKIYAYEGNAGNAKELQSNIQLLPCELRNKITVVNEYIDNSTKFETIEEKITFINADIEGNELALIESMKERISNDRPVIALCMYHKPSDLVDIPQRLRNYLPDSRFILRKYESWMGAKFRKDELVLYAVPNERLLI